MVEHFAHGSGQRNSFRYKSPFIEIMHLKSILQVAFDKYSQDRDIATLSGLITGESMSTSDVDNLVNSTPSTDNVCFIRIETNSLNRSLNSSCILNE